MSQGLTKPKPAEIAGTIEAIAIRDRPAIMTDRRLKLSATAPAMIERMNAGKVVHRPSLSYGSQERLEKFRSVAWSQRAVAAPASAAQRMMC
ncbi:hypothetical protein ATY79_26540 [Rhizobium sp. R693]|nr:hypothetical protein ATY79_26540 [Rhizobium sp. R693]